MGLEVLRQHLQRKTVVDDLHHQVDGAGQLVPVIQIPQVPEMPRVLLAAQRMLNVARDSRVHILVGAFLAGKCGGFVVMNAAEAHCAAVADVFVNAVNTETDLRNL